MSSFSIRFVRVLWTKILLILRHPLFWIMLLAFGVRLYGVIQFPLVHDEITSILDGVNKTKVSPVHFFFKASLKHTLGITPLYFWVERLFTDVFGQNKYGLRLFPLLSGVATTWLVYAMVKKRFDRNIAILSAFVTAFSDIFIWTTSKSQFFEALVLPLSLPIFYLATSENKNRFYYISLLSALVFLANFGRGVFLLLCFLAWYAFVKLFEFVRLDVTLARLFNSTVKEALQLSAFLWLVPLWIAGAQQFAFYNPIQSAVGGGDLYNIWDALYRFSFGYGVATKQAWAGSIRGAFLVFNDTNVWPATTLLFVPFVWGQAILIGSVWQHWKDKDATLFKRDSFIVVLALISLFLLFSKGIVGARFHLFYFLSFTVSCSIALWSVANSFRDDKRKWILAIFVFVAGTYAAYSSSWENWPYSVWDDRLFYRSFVLSLVVTLVFGAAAFLKDHVRARLANGFLALFLSIVFVFLLFRGPLVWGTQLYSDPDQVNRLFDLEGNEETVIDFAVQRNRPEICHSLPQDYQEQCLSLIKGPK